MNANRAPAATVLGLAGLIAGGCVTGHRSVSESGRLRSADRAVARARLIEGLKSNSPGRRIRTARACTGLQDEQVLDQVAVLLDDRDSAARSAAAMVLARSERPEIVRRHADRVRALLTDKSRRVQANAAYALIIGDIRSERAWAALESLMRKGSATAHVNLIRLLPRPRARTHVAASLRVPDQRLAANYAANLASSVQAGDVAPGLAQDLLIDSLAGGRSPEWTAAFLQDIAVAYGHGLDPERANRLARWLARDREGVSGRTRLHTLFLLAQFAGEAAACSLVETGLGPDAFDVSDRADLMERLAYRRDWPAEWHALGRKIGDTWPSACDDRLRMGALKVAYALGDPQATLRLRNLAPVKRDVALFLARRADPAGVRAVNRAMMPREGEPWSAGLILNFPDGLCPIYTEAIAAAVTADWVIPRSTAARLIGRTRLDGLRPALRRLVADPAVLVRWSAVQNYPICWLQSDEDWNALAARLDDEQELIRIDAAARLLLAAQAVPIAEE